MIINKINLFIFVKEELILKKFINSKDSRNKISSLFNLRNKNILYAKGGNGEEDEEKSSNMKNINSRLLRIEKKMDFLLERDSKDVVNENDFPKFHFSESSLKKDDISLIETNENDISLLKQILNEKIWKKIHMLTSEEGYNINDIIQPGIDNPDHPIGLVSYSKDCYYTFEDILISAAQKYHQRNLHLLKYERDTNDMIISVLNSMDNFLEKNIYEIKISTNRNLEGFPFSGKINRNQRREITSRLYEQIKKFENFIYEDQEKGKFSFFENKNNDNQNVFNKKFDQFLQACGFYRDFPDGRMAYISNDGNINVITNIEDHLKIILDVKNNNDSGFSIKSLIDYFEFLKNLENSNRFCYDENLGYVNSLINNLG